MKKTTKVKGSGPEVRQGQGRPDCGQRQPDARPCGEADSKKRDLRRAKTSRAGKRRRSLGNPRSTSEQLEACDGIEEGEGFEPEIRKRQGRQSPRVGERQHDARPQREAAPKKRDLPSRKEVKGGKKA